MRPFGAWMLAMMLAASLGTAAAGLFIPRGAAGDTTDPCGCTFSRWDVVALLGGGKALMIDHATGKLVLGDLPSLPPTLRKTPEPKGDSF